MKKLLPKILKLFLKKNMKTFEKTELDSIFGSLHWDFRELKKCLILYEKIQKEKSPYSEVFGLVDKSLYSHIIITLAKFIEQQEIDPKKQDKRKVSIFDLISNIQATKKEKTTLRNKLLNSELVKVREIRNVRVAHSDEALHTEGHEIGSHTIETSKEFRKVLEEMKNNKCSLDNKKWELNTEEMKTILANIEAVLNELEKTFGIQILQNACRGIDFYGFDSFSDEANNFLERLKT